MKKIAEHKTEFWNLYEEGLSKKQVYDAVLPFNAWGYILYNLKGSTLMSIWLEIVKRHDLRSLREFYTNILGGRNDKTDVEVMLVKQIKEEFKKCVKEFEDEVFKRPDLLTQIINEFEPIKITTRLYSKIIESLKNKNVGSPIINFFKDICKSVTKESVEKGIKDLIKILIGVGTGYVIHQFASKKIAQEILYSYKIQKIAQEIVDETNWEKSKELSNKIADYLATKLSSVFVRDTGKKSITGWEINFRSKSSKNHYAVSSHPDYDNNWQIRLEFYEEIEIRSESLADPKLNYESTSARIVKLKKRKLRKEYDSEKKALRAIDIFFRG